jgi:hypothetical protein
MEEGFRGKLFYFDKSANIKNLSESYHYYNDGLLVVKDGLVEAAGDFRLLTEKFPGLHIQHYGQCYILPGFIDATFIRCKPGQLLLLVKNCSNGSITIFFRRRRDLKMPDMLRKTHVFFWKG